MCHFVAQTACSGRVDISFIIDASGSIRIERFPKVLDFVVSVIDQLTVGPNQTQIAALTYSDNPVLQFLLNTYNNKEDVQLAIRRMQFIGGRTNSADAMALMVSFHLHYWSFFTNSLVQFSFSDLIFYSFSRFSAIIKCFVS